MIRFGVALPQDLLAADARHFAELADQAGAHSLWTLEPPVDRLDLVDPLIQLAVAATVPGQAALGVAVLLAAARNPLLLARQLASLQQLSGGRIIAGVGVGETRGVFDGGGVDITTRAVRLEETVEFMRTLWRNDPVAYEGRFFTYHGPGVRPRLPRPPSVWFGGRHPKALARAARMGDGWMGAGSTASADFAVQCRTIRDLVGTRPFAIAKRVYVVVDDQRERGWRRLEAFCAGLYGDAALGRRVGIAGSLDDCVEQLSPVTAAAPDVIVLNPVDQPFDQLERLAPLL